MDAIEQTVVTGHEGGGDWLREGEGIRQEHLCLTHGHRQWCEDGQREGGRSGCRWAEGENGTSVIV